MKSLAVTFLFLCITPTVFCVRCYQCSSSQNLLEDTCGAYKKFDTESHIAVECNSDESNVPGSFCTKLTQQGPKGFIWDGRWRQVIRRCASVAETGVTGVCNWGVYENGVYWEACYCSNDECNNATSIQIHGLLILSMAGLIMYMCALPETLTTACGRCSPKQKAVVRKLLLGIKSKSEPRFVELLDKYDPTQANRAALYSFLVTGV